MIAVLKHEIRQYFHSLTAYVFGAFLLVFVGIGTMMYNLKSGYSNFEYVLNFSALIFILIIPILTMRVLAEERKQKTDQLLYALPISTARVILGKYLALLVLFAIPLAIIACYPLLLAQYGDVYLLTAYGSLLAFFIMGAALIAVGVFLSSLTENQGFAAGLGVAVILFNYFSVSLAEYVSATALGSALVLAAVGLALGRLVAYLTKNNTAGYCVGLGTMAAVLCAYRIDTDAFEGLVPQIMTKLSLFERLDTFTNGVFDLTGIAFYLSVSVLFLFLSVQSMEKRRYN